MIIQQPLYQDNGSGGGPGVPGPQGIQGPPGGTTYILDLKLTSYTVTQADQGHILAFNTDTSTTCTLPPDLEETFVVKVVQLGKGVVRFLGSGNAQIYNIKNHKCTSGKGAEVTLTLVSKNVNATTFNLTGDTGFNGPDFKFSINYSGMEGGSVIPGQVGTDFPRANVEHFKYFLRKGITHIRLPIKWERAQPTLNGPLDESYMQVVDEAAALAQSLGMTMSLDVHNYTQYKIGDTVYYIGDPQVPVSSFGDLWGKLASRYLTDAVNPSDNTKMIFGNTFTQYDLMNEPISRVLTDKGWMGVTITTLANAYQAAIDAIRLVNPKPDLVIEGLGYSSAYQWLDNGNDILKNLVDPQDKLVFSAHCYLDRDNSGTHYVWAEEVAAGDYLDPLDLNANPPKYAPLDFNIGVKRLSVFGNWITSNGLRGNIGEIGVAKESDGWLQALDRAFAYLKSQKITCTYWNSGPWYDAYPYGFGLTGVPLDNPQVAVMNKNMGLEVLNELKHVVTGPAYGSVNKESLPFTLSLSGYFRSSVVYIPSDGNQGGTFNPSRIEIPSGFNGKASFTYTPKYNKVFQISLTNNAGITPSAPLGYSTVTDMFSAESSSVTNIIWPYKLKANYLGLCVRLKRSSDNAIRDFGFVNDQLYSAVDVEAIKNWAGNSTNIFIVKAYDQSGNGNDLVAPTTVDNSVNDGGPPPSDADFAQLIFDSKGEPFFKFNNSRYDMLSPLNGLSGWTVMTVARPTTSTPNRIASWDLIENHNFMMNGQLSIQGETSVSFAPMANELHSYFSRYRANTPNGIQAYKDGIVVGQADSSSAPSIKFQHRRVVNVGYFKFSTSSVYVGDLKGLIIFSGAVSDATIASFQARMQLESLGTGLYFPTVSAQISTASNNTLTSANNYTDNKNTALATAVTAQILAAGLGDPNAMANAISTQVNVSKVAEDRLAFIKKTQWTGHLRGVNLACAEFGVSTNAQGVVSGVPGVKGTTYRYGTTDEIDYYLSKGVQIIRMPFLWERLQKVLAGDFDQDELKSLKDLATYATSLGIRVILDPHNYSNRVVNNANFPIGATYSSDTPSGTVTLSTVVTWSMWEDFCFRLGNEFKDNPLIIFLVCNEPNKFVRQAFDQNQHAINGYRKSGAANLIQCPGNAFTSAMSYLSNGNDINETLYDPFNNFHLELHQYLNASNNGESDTVNSWAVGPLRMQKMTEWARAKGFKCHLGEFNAGTRTSLVTSIEMDSLREHQAYVLENSDVWASSTIWAAGPWWGEGRNSVEPTGSVGAWVDQTRLLEIMKLKDNPYPRPGAVIDIDFTKGKIYGERAINRVLNIVQAGITYAHGVKGDWILWDPNKLRITGRGLMIEEGRTNYLKTIISPTDTGINQTRCSISGGYSAPDGTYNAFKMTVDASTSTHYINLNNSYTVYPGSIAAGSQVTVSMFCKADSTTPYGYFSYISAGDPTTRVVTSSKGYSTLLPETANGWRRGYFSYVPTSLGGIMVAMTPSAFPAFGTAPDPIAGTGIEGMQFWQPQMEKGVFPTSPIFVSSKSSFETRDPDVVTFVNRALTLIKGDFTMVMETEWLPQVGVDVNLLTLDSVVALKSASTYVAGSDLGVSQLTSNQSPGIPNVDGSNIPITNPRSDPRAPSISDGVNIRRIPVKYGVSVKRSGTSRVVVGAEFALSVGANTSVPATTTATLGPVNGFIRNLQIYDTFMDTTVLDSVLRAQ